MYPHLWFPPRLNVESPNWRKERERGRRIAHLLPWLSVEALKNDPLRFLGLLYNRTRYTLEQWALIDNKQLALAWVQGYISAYHSPMCIKMHGPDYGKCTAWQEGAAHRWGIVGHPRATMIIEAQGFLMFFLREIVERLLQGIDISKPGSSEKWTQLAHLRLKQANSVEAWSPYLHRPFSAARIFDIESLLSLARTRS